MVYGACLTTDCHRQKQISNEALGAQCWDSSPARTRLEIDVCFVHRLHAQRALEHVVTLRPRRSVWALRSQANDDLVDRVHRIWCNSRHLRSAGRALRQKLRAKLLVDPPAAVGQEPALLPLLPCPAERSHEHGQYESSDGCEGACASVDCLPLTALPLELLSSCCQVSGEGKDIDRYRKNQGNVQGH